MKKIILFLSAAAIFMACKEDISQPELEFSTTGNTAEQIEFNNKEVIVTVNSIEDSRCPENANCVWAGQALVNFDLSISGDSFEDQELCLGCIGENAAPESKSFKVGEKNYEISLKSVSPFPNTNNTDEEKTAQFSIR